MLIGTRYFQAKFISRSTRIRGRVARIQNIRKTKPAHLEREDRDQDQVDQHVRQPVGVRVDRLAGNSVNGSAPPSQEQQRSQAADSEDAQVLGQEEQAEPHPRILGVVAGDDLRLGLGQVERRPVHLGDVGDQQDHERDDSRAVRRGTSRTRAACRRS